MTSRQLIGFCHFHSIDRVSGRSIEIGRDAKKTITIANAYPYRSDAIVNLQMAQLQRATSIRRKAVTWGTVDYRTRTGRGGVPSLSGLEHAEPRPRNGSGSLAIFAAIRRASSLLSSLAAERRSGSSSNRRRRVLPVAVLHDKYPRRHAPPS